MVQQRLLTDVSEILLNDGVHAWITLYRSILEEAEVVSEIKSNQIKFIEQKRAWRLLQVAKTLDTVRIKPTSITCIHG